ncbi:MAG: DUF1697 domain-containing protein [Anaerolineales bacterium]|nr:DUF1697 domain-containing protein [Anaerolineales bacterium]
MNIFVALLRGINVGGRNKLPMRELVQILESLGLSNVKTYIQSGNAIFQTPRTGQTKLAEDISTTIGQSHGFTPHVLLLSLDELKTAVSQNPFPEAADAPKTLHLYFLTSAPAQPDLTTLESLKTAREQFQLINNVFYLYAPDGIGRSKLAERVERALGVAATARNWRTVSKVLEMGTAVST